MFGTCLPASWRGVSAKHVSTVLWLAITSSTAFKLAVFKHGVSARWGRMMFQLDEVAL